MKKVLHVVFLLVLLMATTAAKDVPMIDTGSSGAGKYVDFGNLSSTGSLTKMTIMAWVYPKAHPTFSGYILGQGTPGSAEDGFGFGLENSAASAGLRFFHNFSTAPGSWYDASAYTLNNWHHIAVTYDGTNVANDPIFYSDGASLGAPTEANTPVGTISDVSGKPVRLCELVGSGFNLQFNGLLPNALVYNRVLSAEEIETAAKSRLAIPSYDGLVFAPQLYGAADTRDGDTLGATNVILDRISGALGVPAGSPVFRAGNLLSLGQE